MAIDTPRKFEVDQWVRIRDFCRGCDREHWRVGIIVGFEPASPRDESSADTAFRGLDATVDRWIVETNNAGFPVVHEFHPAKFLIPADRWNPPFCAWCGKERRTVGFHDEDACRDFYHAHGRPPRTLEDEKLIEETAWRNSQ